MIGGISMENKVAVVFAFLFLALAGCVQQTSSTVFICSDGSQVSNASLCITSPTAIATIVPSASIQPSGNKNMPPSEAIAACNSKSIGETCTFLMRGETQNGKCDDKPGVLACAPDKVNSNQSNGQVKPDLNPGQSGDQSTSLSVAAQNCIAHAKDNPHCKDCCDCLSGTDSASRTNCRNTCATHDFSGNSDFITITVPSTSGPNGDYSSCTVKASSQDCKICCENTLNLQCGDYQYCRTACNVKFNTTSGPSEPANPSATPPAQGSPNPDANKGSEYTIEQAVSDKAQLNTLAFSGLGFLTGDLCADSFLPPGKVADFFGFQHLRDITANGKGHDTDFVTNSANNVLYILNADQKAKMLALAKAQGSAVNQFAMGRYPLMAAFRRQLNGDIPSGKTGLSRIAVENYSAALFVQDAQISIDRAKLYSGILNTMNSTQKAYLDKMVSGGFASWAVLPDQVDKVTWSHDEDVLVMTYASEMFGWYAGDLEADTYFCPERQADYFGGFYIKDAPAIGNAGYTIDEAITGDQGSAFIAILDSKQQPLITGLTLTNKDALTGIVDTRREMSTELRKYLTTGSANESKILSLGALYGKLDGDISYNAATAFAQVGSTLTSAQTAKMLALRNLGNYTCGSDKIYLYSEKVVRPAIPSTDFLFN